MSIIHKRIGIIGGGQLGKMMILEAKRLGLYTAILDPAADCPASSIADRQIVSSFGDARGYFQLADLCDVITYEFEHINTDALEALERQGHIIYPSVTSLKVIQNKLTQKTTLASKGIPVPRFAAVSGADEIKEYGKAFGYPLMLKAITGGYDGKGNALIQSADGISNACRQLNGAGLMVEEFVRFDKEISVIACRTADGDVAVYPVAENIHVNSILDTTIVPAAISESLSQKAKTIAGQVMEVFSGVGTFCVELFAAGDNNVYVNEVAPRPHNSGHYTIEACFANQFENHIRAIIGLPLGDTSLISPAVMVNLLGENDGPADIQGLNEAYQDPKVHVHFYGKSISKPGRKMAHFTVTDKTAEAALERARRVRGVLRVVAANSI